MKGYTYGHKKDDLFLNIICKDNIFGKVETKTYKIFVY